METNLEDQLGRPVPAGLTTGIFLAALALALLVLVWLPAFSAPAYQFGVRNANDWWDSTYTVQRGVHAGATVDLDATPLTERMRLDAGASKGTTIDVPVVQDGKPARATLEAADPADPYFPWVIAFMQTIAILVGFLIAIRLPAIMAFAFLLAVASIDVILADRVFARLTDAPFLWFTIPVNLVLDAFPSFALLVFAARLPDGRTAGWRKTLARVADSIALAGFFAYAWIAFTRWPFREPLYHLMVLVPPIAVVAIAGLLYVRSRGTQRARIAIVLAALVVYEAAYFLSEISGPLWNPHNSFYFFDMAVNALILPSAVAYAAFRHRLLDVGFVLNRTAVIGITSALLVPVFGVLESLVERFVSEASHVEGLVAELGIVVVLVSLFRFVHGKVDRWVDAFVFRERHADEVALLDFTRAAAFYTKRAAVVSEALDLIKARARVKDAGLYVASGGGYSVEGTTREQPLPALDADDAVAVALRADARPLDLSPFKTALSGERAYPLTLAGKLEGFLVVGPRVNEEQMPPDIDAAVVRVAEAVGKALESIEKERLSQEVAEARSEAARSRRDAEAAWRAVELLRGAQAE
jgi:hypothetical protein